MNNQLDQLRIGFISIIRTTFDVPLAEAVTQTAFSQLESSDCFLSGSSGPVTSLEEAQQAAAEFQNVDLDLLVILQATFADSTMVMTLAENISAPLLLWAIPEAHTGGRLRLNSLCGINLAGHALTRNNYHYEYIYAAPDAPEALEKIAIVGRAARTRTLLRKARLGRVGENPTGFETCLVDSEALKARLGLQVIDIDLHKAVFQRARNADPDAVESAAASLRGQVSGLDDLDTQATRGTLSTYVTLKQLAQEENLDGYAVRCWPEFFTELGCAACGSMSMLSNEMTPCSCEADVNGTITQLILQWLSGQPAFGSDLVSIDADADALVLWHCGLAPLSMADDVEQPGVTVHSNRKLPLLMDFSLKPGRVTVARLSEAQGNYRLVIGSGEILRGSKAFTGTTGLLRFNRPAADVLDTIMTEGLEHHISLTYGDHVPALRVLARMLDLPILELT